MHVGYSQAERFLLEMKAGVQFNMEDLSRKLSLLLNYGSKYFGNEDFRLNTTLTKVGIHENSISSNMLLC